MAVSRRSGPVARAQPTAYSLYGHSVCDKFILEMISWLHGAIQIHLQLILM